MIRVAVVDDHAVVRAGFRVLLDSEPDMEVVGEAGDGGEAVALARRTLPDIVLMDIRMPFMDGLEATRQIAADRALAGVRILVVTTFESDEYVFEALRAGASGFLAKNTEPVDLIAGVRIIYAGESLLSPRATRGLIADFVSRPNRVGLPITTELSRLTDREREVMALVALGLSNQEIAVELFMSPATARTHVSRSMTKLNARDRSQLVVFAYQSGLVAPGS